ncbi:uncharacterized protein (DUF1800 family) [Sulfitobacter undariae]|uniref:Uncharacterized protein (DUF1800 family) n=1 Tax=Sulfitobacter undariae TaxID=1563671 RepID=A0A7W6E8E1_9RHOB|nr:DUF1800 domain-containing protein [Sulfitobacter undariae]MBB3993930.1 uncharacterized protein (DUF1800 family) [Sulfitobacter undariae]
MKFTPHLADIRFGCGLSPAVPSPVSVAQMLDSLQKPDTIAARFPIETFDLFQKRVAEADRLGTVKRKNAGTSVGLAAKKAGRVLNKEARIAHVVWMGQHLNRWTWTQAPLRERLSFFWADHFTVTGKAGVIRRAASPYLESVIRPRITGLFEDMLIAAALHPLMVHYLDQDKSVGPNSRTAAKGGKLTGLNENLAREVLELHTLGVNGPYTQTDVRELAELFTGISKQSPMRFKFRKNNAEPGSETVLGKTYGGGKARKVDVETALRDLARHPATARHLAWKLAVHFTSDTPDPALVEALTTRYLETGGDLFEVTKAMLSHPAAWAPKRANVKPAFHFMASAMRALALPADTLASLDEKTMRRLFITPLAQMGHVWEKPDGPDGLPEEDSAWIAPQGVAARLQWAITVPQALLPDLPDSRDFVKTTLGDFIPPAVQFAADSAESTSDGVGLVLASPAFQRT